METAEQSEKQHGLSDIWKRINYQGDQIASIAKAQVATDARLQNLDDKVTQGFTDIKHELRSISHDNHRPKNWLGIVSVIIGVTSVAAGFVFMLHKFNEVRINRQDTIIEDRGAWLRESAEVHGVHNARLAELNTWIEYLRNEVDAHHEFTMLTRERLAYLEGYHEAKKVQ